MCHQAQGERKKTGIWVREEEGYNEKGGLMENGKTNGRKGSRQSVEALFCPLPLVSFRRSRTTQDRSECAGHSAGPIGRS